MNSLGDVSRLTTENDNWQWPARLELLLAHNHRGTVLKHCRHRGPLYVQKPFYPEGKDCAHIYLLHPPGGIVSGDELNISLALTDNAKGLITTPGAARIYHAREHNPLQQQRIDIQLAKHACIEWFPMETILYNGAHAALTTQIDLDETSHFVGWEINCLGLPASQKPFDRGRFTQHYIIRHNGLPVLIDRFHFDAAKHKGFFKSPAGLQGQTTSGFFIAGPFSIDDEYADGFIELLRTTLEQQQFNHQIAITWIHRFLVARFLGESANQARDGFSVLWELLRPELIKRKACAPRIWLT